MPTDDAPGIFADWAVSANGNSVSFDDRRIVWDFGTNTQYPVLCPVDTDGDGRFTSEEFGTQPRDILPHVYFSQSEFTAGEEDGTVEVSVVMFNAPAGVVTITVLCSDGTATSPDDYARGSDGVALSFDALSAVDFLTTATFTITINADEDLEADETIALSFDTDTLPDSVALATPSTATVVIIDDDLRRAYDADGDGLIDVHDLEQLNAIRYDLNGDGEIDDTTSNDPAIDGSKASIYVSAFHGFCPPDDVSYVDYELCADLNFAGTRWALDATTDGIPDAVAEGWEPIGTSRDSQFTAIFEGNGHTIIGLYINRPSTDFVGLFGATGIGAIIRNVSLEEVEVTGQNNVGSLVGHNLSDDSITCSYATGTVTGVFSVGGLVGYNNGIITSSYATGSVTGTGSSVGGLVGENLSGGDITCSYATGTVTGDVRVGGLVGANYGAITSSYATGDVSGRTIVGGLVGLNDSGTITSSYSTGDVSGSIVVGGLVGGNTGGDTITSSYYSSAAIVTQNGVAVEPDAYMRSIVELARVPTDDAPGIFADWAVSANGNSVSFDDKRIVWDFGTNTQYPVLCPVDADGDGRFTSEEFGMQSRDIPTQVYFAQSEFTVGEEGGTVEVSVVMFNAPADAVTVTVLVSDGTATSPDDYTYDSDGVALSFDALSAVDLLTTATFIITIHADEDLEADETIALSFSTRPDSVALATPSTATVFIVDDEARSAYDTDNDGLIEVHTVEQLNAIRCDLNGDGEIDDTTSDDPAVAGSKAAAYVAVFYGVCPPDDVSYRGYELAADLNFAGSRWALNATADGIADAVAEGWEPIGDESNRYFNTFEGNGHTITGLCINRPSTDQVGLFGAIGDQLGIIRAFIRDVGLEEVYVHGANSVGGLVGYNYLGEVAASYVTGTVTGNGHVGGLVGGNLSSGSITSSYSTATVAGTGNSVGGLVGYSNGPVTSSYATGDVTG